MKKLISLLLAVVLLLSCVPMAFAADNSRKFLFELSVDGKDKKEAQPGDIAVNVCKEKHLTAVRSKGADEALTLITPIQMSLEEAIEFIADDELIEVTPKSIRLRKQILDTPTRLKAQAARLRAAKA